MSERSVNHSTFVIERSYPADRDRVFATFSDPVKKRHWFAEGGTKLIFTEQAAFFEGGDGPQMREDGWRQLLERLSQELVQ